MLTARRFAGAALDAALIELSQPSKENDPILERRELRAIAAKRSDPLFDLEVALSEHVKTFAYLGYREPLAPGYDAAFFRQRLDEVTADHHDIQSIDLPNDWTPEEQGWIDLLKEFVWFRNYRADKHYEALFFLEPLWHRLAEHCHLAFEYLLEYRLAEVRGLLDTGSTVDHAIIHERQSGRAFLIHDGQISLSTGAVFAAKERSLTTAVATTQLKGMIASTGSATGPVKVVLRSSEQHKVQPGDILVTTMTTPDFLSCMKQAAAFVTDEGGITCHAAIIARELGKPCIIGTKHATKVFEDGDLVEVDAMNGTIRKVGA
jgi:phosphohistidine swiveling domain-containing protein